MQIVEYIKPELLIVSIVLYFLSRMIKQSSIFDSRYIPLINCVAGIFICGTYVVSSCPITTGQQFSMALFTAITQGILVSGISTYAYKIISDDGKLDLKGAFGKADSGPDETDNRDMLGVIKRDMKREIINDIEHADAGNGCDLKCEIKHGIASDIKNELISELEAEILSEIEDELLNGMRKEESTD